MGVGTVGTTIAAVGVEITGKGVAVVTAAATVRMIGRVVPSETVSISSGEEKLCQSKVVSLIAGV